MKKLLLISIFLSHFLFSFEQTTQKQLLIKNNVMQVNSYSCSAHSQQELIASDYYNDSGLIIKSIAYLFEPASSENHIYFQKYLMYEDNKLIKDSVIYADEINVIYYSHSYHKKSTTSYAKKDGVLSYIVMHKGDDEKYTEKIKYYNDNRKLYKKIKLKKDNKVFFNKTFLVEGAFIRLASAFKTVNISSSKYGRHYRMVYKRNVVKEKDIIHKKTKEERIVTFNYDENDLLMEEKSVIINSYGSSYSCTRYEYLK